jgi:hypothetical protein
MLDVLFGWPVVGVLVPVFIGIAVGVLSMNQPAFGVARAFLGLAAGLILLKTSDWLIGSGLAATARVLATVVVFSCVGLTTVEAWRWINQRQDLHARPPNPQESTVSNEKKDPLVIHVETHAANSPAVVTTGPNSPIMINPRVNPYEPVVTWDFSGGKRISSPGRSELNLGPEFGVFQRLTQLHVQQNWMLLAAEAEAQIAKTPGWLTPYLLAGIAHVNTGDRTRAIARLTFVAERAGGDPQYADASRILRELGAIEQARPDDSGTEETRRQQSGDCREGRGR